jgi:hypothetical protein
MCTNIDVFSFVLVLLYYTDCPFMLTYPSPQLLQYIIRENIFDLMLQKLRGYYFF